MELLEYFKDCMSEIHERVSKSIELINHGGCAIFAVELVKRMHKLGMNPSIRVYGEEEVDVSLAEQHILEYEEPMDVESWNDNGVEFVHIVVEWAGYLWDAETIESIEDAYEYGWHDYPLLAGEISFNSLKEIALQRDGWNSTYNRSQNPILYNILDDVFERLENNLGQERQELIAA